MPLLDNRPDVARLRRQLRHTAAASGIVIPPLDDLDALLSDLLVPSIALVEDKTSMPFNGRAVQERRDGNGTNAIMLFRGPITSVSLVKVELPVLALSRTYTDDEIKIYRRQRRLTIFTYKMAAEHATMHLDQQVYANILPELPQCVFINYTAGFPRYHDQLDRTSLDGTTDIIASPRTVLAGDQRDPVELNYLAECQQAATCDAAASFLGMVARNEVSLTTSVSFDGMSKGLNPQAYGPAIESLTAKRDELLRRRSALIMLSTG